MLLVIDAIDECDDAQTILFLLAQRVPKIQPLRS